MPMYERDGSKLEAPLKDKARLGEMGWKLEKPSKETKVVKPKSISRD